MRADNLSARLAHMRAVLHQKNWAPFTKRDVELRKELREIYEGDLITLLPLTLIPSPSSRSRVQTFGRALAPT